jgi:Transposase family tnp2
VKQLLTQQVCGRRLQKARIVKSREYTLPVRHFLYHNFKEWLGEMLCRPGIEDLMDRHLSSSSTNGVMEDIWDAPGLYNIPGVDGHPFLCKNIENEGRYVFSFNMDGFNPFQLKQAGRSATVMGLYMVCLNLPLEERFKSENMFLAGIIPGPKEPSMEQINHFLSPLVDDLLDSYINGVHYTRTWKYPNGRNTRSALALIICDLPAARQAMGFTGHQSANFCSYCKLQFKDINNLDQATWEPRSCTEHRKLAFEWRDARSEKERVDITKTHGVRYSEFLRLPYFDPIMSVCVDPMHAFFLRILSHHCRDIWGMDINIEDGDGTTTDPVSSEVRSSTEFQKAYLTFRTGTLEKLRTFKTKTLSYLANDRNIQSKRETLERLMERLTKAVCTIFVLL